jgi:hypothetical protein
MKVMKYAFALLLPLTLATYLLTGCGNDKGSSGSNGGGSETNQPPPALTNNLAGHTFQFTVTKSLNFSEPEGAAYTVAYTDADYTFFPSPMNRETTQQEVGTYTYKPETGMLHYTRPDHQDINGVFQFDSPTSGTIHLNGPEGEMEDANFTIVGG